MALMSSRAGALKSAMQDEAGDAGAEGFGFMPDPQQLDLLRDRNGKLPADALRRVRVERGRGRPPGARNKRTEAVARWFIGKYGDPLSALGEIINTPTDVLYEQMVLAQGGEAKGKRVSGRDAMELRLSAIKEALPYIHGKQPIAVDVTGKADAVLFIPGLNAPAAFDTQQLTQAVEALGVDAIEEGGIRLDDGRLLAAPDAPAEDDTP